MTVTAFLILGLSCIAIAFMPKEEETIILVIFLIGRTAGSAGIQVYILPHKIIISQYLIFIQTRTGIDSFLFCSPFKLSIEELYHLNLF